ncbi:hypothetical protein KBC99_00905 [Candidatus Saccharibacteria bacterium]|nr:hypothetical protein [Candidatus Saccharibacteria bacterium]
MTKRHTPNAIIKAGFGIIEVIIFLAIALIISGLVWYGLRSQPTNKSASSTESKYFKLAEVIPPTIPFDGASATRRNEKMVDFLTNSAQLDRDEDANQKGTRWCKRDLASEQSCRTYIPSYEDPGLYVYKSESNRVSIFKLTKFSVGDYIFNGEFGEEASPAYGSLKLKFILVTNQNFQFLTGYKAIDGYKGNSSDSVAIEDSPSYTIGMTEIRDFQDTNSSIGVIQKIMVSENSFRDYAIERQRALLIKVYKTLDDRQVALQANCSFEQDQNTGSFKVKAAVPPKCDTVQIGENEIAPEKDKAQKSISDRINFINTHYKAMYDLARKTFYWDDCRECWL